MLTYRIPDWFLCSCDSGETVNNRFASNAAYLSVSVPVFSIFPCVFYLNFRISLAISKSMIATNPKLLYCQVLGFHYITLPVSLNHAEVYSIIVVTANQ